MARPCRFSRSITAHGPPSVRVNSRDVGSVPWRLRSWMRPSGSITKAASWARSCFMLPPACVVDAVAACDGLAGPVDEVQVARLVRRRGLAKEEACRDGQGIGLDDLLELVQ